MNKKIFILILFLIVSSIKCAGMHVKGSKLYNGDGKEFIFRGVNLAHAWYKDKTKFP